MNLVYTCITLTFIRPYLTYPCFGIHVRPVAQQDSNNVSLVGPGRQVERCLTTHGGRVRRAATLDQVDYDVHTAHEGRHVQRSQARLCNTTNALTNHTTTGNQLANEQNSITMLVIKVAAREK